MKKSKISFYIFIIWTIYYELINAGIFGYESVNKTSFIEDGMKLYEQYKSDNDPCYKEAIELVKLTCPKMNTYSKIMVASFLMNCQFESAGRPSYWCNNTCSDRRSCLNVIETFFKELSSHNITTEIIAQYFIHIDNICYYINSDEKYNEHLNQMDLSNEEILKKLVQSHQRIYELPTKQNTSNNIVHTFLNYINNTANYINNVSYQIVDVLLNLNGWSIPNSRFHLLDIYGISLGVLYHWDSVFRKIVWKLYKFGGISFFGIILTYIILITYVTNTKYTRVKLAIVLCMLFVIDAFTVICIVGNQPLKHLNKYVFFFRCLCIVVINVVWGLMCYYIPKLESIVETKCVDGNSTIIDKIKSYYWPVENSLDATLLDHEKTKNHTVTTRKNSRNRAYNESDSSLSDYEMNYFSTIERLPKPCNMAANTSIIDQPPITHTLLSTSKSYISNAIDSLKLMSPTKRIFNSINPSFATSTVIRKASNKKPLSPQIPKNMKTNNDNIESPTKFKVPMKDMLSTKKPTTDIQSNTLSFYNRTLYKNKIIPPPTDPISIVGSKNVSHDINHEVKYVDTEPSTSSVERKKYRKSSKKTLTNTSSNSRSKYNLRSK